MDITPSRCARKQGPIMCGSMVAALPRSYGLGTQLKRERGGEKEGEKRTTFMPLEFRLQHHASATSCSCNIIKLQHHKAATSCSCKIMHLQQHASVTSGSSNIMQLQNHKAAKHASVTSCSCNIIHLQHHAVTTSCSYNILPP